MLISFRSRHYYFFEKLKIVEKQPCKLNCSYGKVSHTLNEKDEAVDRDVLLKYLVDAGKTFIRCTSSGSHF